MSNPLFRNKMFNRPANVTVCWPASEQWRFFLLLFSIITQVPVFSYGKFNEIKIFHYFTVTVHYPPLTCLPSIFFISYISSVSRETHFAKTGDVSRETLWPSIYISPYSVIWRRLSPKRSNNQEGKDLYQSMQQFIHTSYCPFKAYKTHRASVSWRSRQKSDCKNKLSTHFPAWIFAWLNCYKLIKI